MPAKSVYFFFWPGVSVISGLSAASLKKVLVKQQLLPLSHWLQFSWPVVAPCSHLVQGVKIMDDISINWYIVHFRSYSMFLLKGTCCLHILVLFLCDVFGFPLVFFFFPDSLLWAPVCTCGQVTTLEVNSWAVGSTCGPFSSQITANCLAVFFSFYCPLWMEA